MSSGEIIRHCPHCGESYSVDIQSKIEKDKELFAVVCISGEVRHMNGKEIKGCGASSAYYENVHEAMAMWNMRNGEKIPKRKWWQFFRRV